MGIVFVLWFALPLVAVRPVFVVGRLLLIRVVVCELTRLLRFVFVAALFLFVVKTRHVVLTENVAESFFLDRLAVGFGSERKGLFAGFVEGYDLKCTRGVDCDEVGGDVFVGGVGYLAFVYVGFEVEVCRICGFESDVAWRETLDAFDIGIDFEIETAFELGTLTGKFLGVERDVLEAGGTGNH